MLANVAQDWQKHIQSESIQFVSTFCELTLF